MSTNINIADKDLKIIIKELWNNANYINIYENLNLDRPEFNWKLGIKEVKPGGYLEVFCGKKLWVQVSSDNINISGYDNLYGQGKASEIICKINN